MSGRLLVSGAQVGAFHHPHPAPAKHDHRGARHRGRGAGHLQRRAPLRGDGPLADATISTAHRLLAGLGPEPLGNGFDAGYLAERLAGRLTAVKAVLIDQRVVAGLGNIYVCEALWRARISPLRPARRRDAGGGRGAGRGGPGGADGRARRRRVVAARLPAGGRRARLLPAFLRGLRPRGRALPRGCGGTIARVVQAGRSSFFCPVCQTLNAGRCLLDRGGGAVLWLGPRRASEGEVPWPTRP